MGRDNKTVKRLEQLESRRLAAVRRVEAGEVPVEVARQLGVDRSSVSRWHKAYRAGGEDAVKSPKRAGRKPRLSEEQWQTVEEKLVAGPLSCGYKTELWTLARIADLIETVTGVRYDPDHLSRVMRQRGFSCQKPKRKAKERNEDEIARWVKEEWPRIQRGQKNREPS